MSSSASRFRQGELKARAKARPDAGGCPQCAAPASTACHPACPEPLPEVPVLILGRMPTYAGLSEHMIRRGRQ